MQLDERTNFSNSKSALSKNFRLALLDLDGVVYRGGNPLNMLLNQLKMLKKMACLLNIRLIILLVFKKL